MSTKPTLQQQALANWDKMDYTPGAEDKGYVQSAGRLAKRLQKIFEKKQVVEANFLDNLEEMMMDVGPAMRLLQQEKKIDRAHINHLAESYYGFLYVNRHDLVVMEKRKEHQKNDTWLQQVLRAPFAFYPQREYKDHAAGYLHDLAFKSADAWFMDDDIVSPEFVISGFENAPDKKAHVYTTDKLLVRVEENVAHISAATENGQQVTRIIYDETKQSLKTKVIPRAMV